MQQEKIKRIHLIYGCIAAALVIALGIALMVSCWQIYQSGPHPYTRASIADKLQQISILIYLAAAAIVGGFVLNILMPLDRQKTKAIRDELVIMNKLAAKAGQPTEEDKAKIEAQRRKRWLYQVLTAGFSCGLLARPVFYLLNRGNFPGVDPTAEITAAAVLVLPPAIISLAVIFIYSLMNRKSILIETEIYKQIIASGNKVTPAPAPNTDKPVLLKTVRFAVLAVALVCIIVGIFNGSAQDVLTKAVKICTECIGLG